MSNVVPIPQTLQLYHKNLHGYILVISHTDSYKLVLKSQHQVSVIGHYIHTIHANPIYSHHRHYHLTSF